PSPPPSGHTCIASPSRTCHQSAVLHSPPLLSAADPSPDLAPDLLPTPTRNRPRIRQGRAPGRAPTTGRTACDTTMFFPYSLSCDVKNLAIPIAWATLSKASPGFELHTPGFPR